MERVWTSATDDHDSNVGLISGGPTLPTRARAIATIRSALESQAGPVLVSGDAGSGKTWLCRRLQAGMPATSRWVSIDLSPANGPVDLDRMIAYRLGLDIPEDQGGARRALGDFLGESAADGGRWILVVDEAQSASPDLLEEIRILANRLGRSDGFAGLVLVGQTGLVRRLATRPLIALSSRLATHVHLRPLDVREARALIDGVAPGHGYEGEVFERLHRDARGNPRRLLQLSTRAHAGRRTKGPQASPLPDHSSSPMVEAVRPVAWEVPVLGATKPPLRIEEGLIEVGWEPTAEPAADSELPTISVAVGETLESEETIHDHYAALQAWTEWAKNQGRTQASGTVGTLDPARCGEDDPGIAGAEHDHPSMRAEAQHNFAPYSRLFSRLREANDTTS